MGWNLNHQLEKITMNVVFEMYNFRLPPTWTVDVVINCPDSYANLDQNDLIWFQLFPSYCADILPEFPHKIWYFHSEILSSCNLLGGYLSNIAIFHFHDYGRKSIGNSCFVLCTPWLVHLFPLNYFAEIAGLKKDARFNHGWNPVRISRRALKNLY